MPSIARIALVAALLGGAAEGADPFLAKPYLQLGDAPSSGDLALLWHADDVPADWSVETRAGASAPWTPAGPSTFRRVAVPGVAPHRVYRATLKGLPPGSAFGYRVKRGNVVAFEAGGKGRKGPDQTYRFVAVGDIAQGTADQRAVAFRMSEARPDFVMVTGDIVYSRGRISEYRDKFWPVYNADLATRKGGGPLLRSVPWVAAPGNHDLGVRDLGKYPDAMAYFYYWDQPLNGPAAGPLTSPLVGPEANRKAFLEGAGPGFPRMGNFSFDYGNAHWIVLDSNPYVDWADAGLRDWVARDLAAARGATWRFVAFHHPGFNSSRAHFREQQMRRLADVFEAGRVDVVFAGHVHNYQRTFPLRFLADRDAGGKPASDGNLVPGRWTLDKTFDGRLDTSPEGVIYLVSGAGGATLYNPDQQARPETWQPFTAKFLARVHSITVVDVHGTVLLARQVDVDGQEIDRFVVRK